MKIATTNTYTFNRDKKIKVFVEIMSSRQSPMDFLELVASCCSGDTSCTLYRNKYLGRPTLLSVVPYHK